MRCSSTTDLSESLTESISAIGSPGARSNRRIALQENQGQGIAMEVILPGLPVVDLSSIAAAIHYGCMGLPQELIDHIMDVLRNDFPSLKACSLTCKAMFASTRRLIHWTINLTERNNRNVLTPEELRRHNWGNPCDHTQLSILSHMGEGGLLRYARRVRIHTHGRFTMGVLITHLHYFQSLDRVHTLSIAEFDAGSWLPHLHGTFFGHFYPTLTSLTLYEPLYNLHLLLQFVLQFPELENLCLVWPRSDGPKFNTDPSVDHHPPLRGRLQLIGCDPVDRWPADFVREFPNGMNFRMVELESFHGAYAQNVLDGCAHTLEDLTFASYSVGKYAWILVFLANTVEPLTKLSSGRERVAASRLYGVRESSSDNFTLAAYSFRRRHQPRLSPSSALDNHFPLLLRARPRAGTIFHWVRLAISPGWKPLGRGRQAP